MKNRLLVLAGLVALLSLLGGCASGRRSFVPMFGGSMERVPLITGSFEELWEQHTITLKPADPKKTENDGSYATDNYGQQTAAPKMFNEISFSVKATRMDSTLVNAGLQQFARLAGMPENEYEAFKERYYTSHSLGDTSFIWLQLETNISQKYLELELWDFYLTDADGKKVKPAQIEAYDIGEVRGAGTFARQNVRAAAFPAEDTGLAYAAKGVELYFVLDKKESRLKLTVARRLNPDVRAEGSWDTEASEATSGVKHRNSTKG